MDVAIPPVVVRARTLAPRVRRQAGLGAVASGDAGLLIEAERRIPRELVLQQGHQHPRLRVELHILRHFEGVADVGVSDVPRPHPADRAWRDAEPVRRRAYRPLGQWMGPPLPFREGPYRQVQFVRERIGPTRSRTVESQPVKARRQVAGEPFAHREAGSP